MPDPSSQFANAATTEETTSRSGVAQFRRTWEAESAHANVLILHGIAEHSGRYEHIGSTLAAAGFTTRAYDHHGHGRSGGRRAHIPSFDVFLDDVEDNLAELRETGLPVVLLGHSMGGLIAFNYCVSGRPLPDVLLLSGPALGAVVPLWQRIAAPIFGRIAPKLFIKNEFDGSFLTNDPDVGKAYIDDPLRVPGATAGLGHAMFTAMKTANENLSKLSIPTMVFHGANDRIVPAHFSEPIGALAVATREVLPGLEHEVLNEASWESTMQSFITFTNDALVG
jgi:acylglycerol lipase